MKQLRLQLRRQPTDTPYCVPAALALITDAPVSEIEKNLRRYLGDQPISGIYYPLCLAVLSDRGIGFEEVFGPRAVGLYLCFNKSHAFVISDRVYYDNSFPNGSAIHKMPRVSKCFEITRG